MLMHELGHWTGHPERLDRDMSGVDGTPEYWFEELVAELSVCFVLAALALPDRVEEFPNSCPSENAPEPDFSGVSFRDGSRSFGAAE